MLLNSDVIFASLNGVFCSKEVANQQYYIYASDNKARRMEVEDALVENLSKTLFGKENNMHLVSEVADEKLIRDLITNTVIFASGLREQLNTATSIAKTKLQEYWTNRTPPLLVVIGSVLLIKLSLESASAHGSTSNSDAAIITLSFALIFIAFLGTFLMLFLRLPHAVDGASKQKASDFYISRKGPLGNWVSSSTVGCQEYEDKVSNCFSDLRKRVDKTVLNVVGVPFPRKQISLPFGDDKIIETMNSEAMKSQNEIYCNDPKEEV